MLTLIHDSPENCVTIYSTCPQTFSFFSSKLLRLASHTHFLSECNFDFYNNNYVKTTISTSVVNEKGIFAAFPSLVKSIMTIPF